MTRVGSQRHSKKKVVSISLNIPFRLYYDLFFSELGYLSLMWCSSSHPLLCTDNVFCISLLHFSSNDSTTSFSRQIFYLTTQSHAVKFLYTIVQILSKSRNSPHLMKTRKFHYRVQTGQPLTTILINAVPSYLRFVSPCIIVQFKQIINQMQQFSSLLS
jgi:hypothetical protein